MRKKLFLLFGGFLAATVAQAQTNTLKINLLSPLMRTLSLSFEHTFGEVSSLQLQGSYTGFTADGESLRGFAIAPEYRYYLSDQPAPRGFYLGPYLRFQHFRSTHDSYYLGGYPYYSSTPTTVTSTIDIFGAGLLLGRQWVLKDRIAVDIFLGPGYNASNDSSNSELIGFSDAISLLPVVSNGFTLRGGFALGLRF